MIRFICMEKYQLREKPGLQGIYVKADTEIQVGLGNCRTVRDFPAVNILKQGYPGSGKIQ